MGVKQELSLSAFIRTHHEEIIVEFASFAKTLMPEGAVMSDAELRDHAEEMLTEIVLDMGLAQTSAEQSNRSRGHGIAKAMEASARLHADDRIQHGYSLVSVLAEFRALRATVLRLFESGDGSDLSEVRRFNESVDEALTESMNRYAAQADLFKDQFIGILSHDLRSPLGAITTGAALLALPEDNPLRRARVAARMLNSCQRMERLIADLLDLTRTRLGGTIPLSRRRTDLQEVCEQAMLEIHAAHPQAVLRLEPFGNLIGMWDPDRLAQVVSNLVGNAVQHGQGTVVTLTAREEADSVTLEVHNGGDPVPAEALREIFEPLSRGNEETNDPGHSIGLGLFIARAIVSAHGGDVQVRSSSAGGTTFRVALPKNPSSAEG